MPATGGSLLCVMEPPDAASSPRRRSAGTSRRRRSAVDHHALAVLERDLADVGAHRRLVVDRRGTSIVPNGVSSFRPLNAATSFSVSVEPGLLDARGERHDRRVADHRAEPRIVVVALAGRQRRTPCARASGSPYHGIAGDDPADRRLVLQRVEVLGLAGQQARRPSRPLNRPRVLPSRTNLARSAPNSTLKIASGLASASACTTAPASILPSGGACSATNSTSGCAAFSSSLKVGRGRLAVFVVRIDDRPALLLQLRRLGHQHRRLHVGRGAQAEGVAVAVLPDDLVGQRLGGEEEHLASAWRSR